MKKLSSSFFAWLIGRRNSPAVNNQGLAVPAAGGLSRLGYIGVALLTATILFAFIAALVVQTVDATLLRPETDFRGGVGVGAQPTITEMNTGGSRSAGMNERGH